MEGPLRAADESLVFIFSNFDWSASLVACCSSLQFSLTHSVTESHILVTPFSSINRF